MIFIVKDQAQIYMYLASKQAGLQLWRRPGGRDG